MASEEIEAFRRNGVRSFWVCCFDVDLTLVFTVRGFCFSLHQENDIALKKWFSARVPAMKVGPEQQATSITRKCILPICIPIFLLLSYHDIENT
jgi:hypothetical protein